MGALISALFLFAVLYWLGFLAYQYFTDPSERERSHKQPGRFLLALLSVVLFLMFVVGVCIPAFGNLAISVGDQRLRIWAIGLIGGGVVTAINFMTGRL
jgi:MFS family permease